MNSGVVQPLPHLIRVGASAADRGLDQCRNAHAPLHNGIVHFSRNASPFRQPEMVADANLTLLEAEHAEPGQTYQSRRTSIEPGCLIEVRPHDQKECSL